LRIVAQALDVEPIDRGAGFLEGELGFAVAVGTGSAKDQNTRLSHENLDKAVFSKREGEITGVFATVYSYGTHAFFADLAAFWRGISRTEKYFVFRKFIYLNRL